MQRKIRQKHNHKKEDCKSLEGCNSNKGGSNRETMAQRLTIRYVIFVFLGGYLVVRIMAPSFHEELTADKAIITQAPDLAEPISRGQPMITDPAPRMTSQSTAAQPVPPTEGTVPNSEFPKFIEEYIQFHDQTKFTPEAKYLIWRCPRGTTCGGTGDRIKGIMTAFYTAVCTRRVLVIDWPLQDARDVSPFLAPHRIDWRVPDQLIPHMGRGMSNYNAVDNYDNPWFKQLTIPAPFHERTMIEMRSNLWSEHFNAVLRVNDTDCIQKMWQKEPPRPNPHYTQDKYLFRMGFWTIFVFGNAVHNRKRDMQQKANLLVYSSNPDATTQLQGQRLLEEHLGHDDAEQRSSNLVSDDGITATKNLRQHHTNRRLLQETSSLAGQTAIQPYVAVHIRTGIGSGWDDPLRHGSQEDYQKFYRCAKRLQQGIFDRQRQSFHCQNNAKYDYQKQLPLLPIFVAADNKVGKQAMVQLDQAASAASGSNTTIRVLDTEIYHIDRSSKQGNHAENTVWGELNVLLESTCLVASRSGFSDLATWLQPTPTGKRCAMMFNKCEDEALVEQALDALDFSCTNQ